MKEYIVTIVLSVLTYLSYVEVRFRMVSKRESEMVERIVALEKDVCATEEVRSIMKEQIDPIKQDISAINKAITKISIDNAARRTMHRFENGEQEDGSI